MGLVTRKGCRLVECMGEDAEQQDERRPVKQSQRMNLTCPPEYPHDSELREAKGRCAPSAGSASLLQTLEWNLWWRGPIHGAICWYLRRCSGAFHHNKYGPAGRYVVLMTEEQYHRYGKVRRSPNKD